VRIEDYPPQEPLSPLGQTYHGEVLRRGAGVVPDAEEGYGEDPYQGIAVFRPAKPDGNVLLFFHGGGWTGGYKEWMAFMAPAFTSAGIVFASAGYRLAPQHVFPTGARDCAGAMAWMGDNAARFGGDRRRLFIGGHSAGGHYSALLAVDGSLPAGTIRGCLPLSGVYDFTEGSGLSQRPRFLGPGPTERAASPIHRIEGRPPPFFLAHGDKDFPHLIPQAQRMEAALRAAGGDVERLVLAGRDHFSASYAGGEPEGPWVPKALDWLRRH
jgi:arylformamidase